MGDGIKFAMEDVKEMEENDFFKCCRELVRSVFHNSITLSYDIIGFLES